MKRLLLFSLGNLIAAGLSAQATYQIGSDSTAVPFLRISPDARAGGMGDGGVACANDVNAMHWNLSGLSFAEKKFSLGISYTPWMRALVPDINLAYIAAYYKPDSLSAIGASLRYFSLGNVIATSPVNGITGQYRPNEFALDVGYTRKVTSHFSAGLTVRFIKSNLAGAYTPGRDFISGMACAGDLSASWRGRKTGNTKAYIVPTAGFCLSNLGPKMWYRDRDSAEYLPMNARFGGGLLIANGTRHELTLHGEANKLLVPDATPDAAGGQKHAQTTLSSGVEYAYDQMFRFRGGYFHEIRSHGANSYFTTGVGIEYNVFQLDFSYLIPVSGMRSPLENTVRFTLTFNFGKLKPPSVTELPQNR